MPGAAEIQASASATHSNGPARPPTGTTMYWRFSWTQVIGAPMVTAGSPRTCVPARPSPAGAPLSRKAPGDIEAPFLSTRHPPACRLPRCLPCSRARRLPCVSRNAGDETRTHKGLPPGDFKSPAFTISPPRRHRDESGGLPPAAAQPTGAGMRRSRRSPPRRDTVFRPAPNTSSDSHCPAAQAS